LNIQEKVDLVFSRFIHRDDVFTRMQYDETKGTSYWPAKEGVCTAKPPCPKKECTHVKRLTVTRDVIFQHLQGDHTIAMYQLADDNTVKWMCIDVDIVKRPPEGTDVNALPELVKQHTLTLGKKLLSVLGRNSFLVERSGSKGYHLWVFFAEAVQARYADALGNWLVLGDAPLGIHCEVFPKQVKVTDYGNQVKLPLGIHKKTNERCFFVDAFFNVYDNQFEKLRDVRLITEEEVKRLLLENNIEVRASIRVEPSGDSSKQYKPCLHRMMHEGLGEGVRDSGTFILACHMREQGLSADMAEAALTVMNVLNKPPLDDETVHKKLQSAYEKDYTSYVCNKSEVDPFCSSSCRFWQAKVSNRWLRFDRKAEDAVGVISRD
jgi:hypothetical protein